MAHIQASSDDAAEPGPSSEPQKAGGFRNMIRSLLGRNGEGKLRETIEEILEDHEDRETPIDEGERQRWVNALMDARRGVKAAKASGNPNEMKTARAAVQTAKVALGERGPVWWDDAEPDLNRQMVENTPYADWYRRLGTRSEA